MAIFVKPTPGMMVNSPDHQNQFLPPEGAEVESSIYWQRKIADGDVEVLAQHAAEEAAPKTQKGSEK